LAEPVYHRLHPLSILIEAIRVVGRLFFAIVIVVVSYMTGSEGDFTEVLVTGLGFFVALAAVFRYLTFRYAVHEGNLTIKSGLIVRQHRTIPLDRIQNINLTRTLAHRILGLVDVEIETASGARAEASLSALTDEQAHVLKARLTGAAPRIASPVLEARRANVVYAPSFKELFLAGATENRLLAILTFIIGLNVVFQGMIERIADDKRWAQVAQQPLVIVGGIVGLVLVGWLFSIATSLVKYYGFELILEDGKLRRQYGLINHIENVIPLRRVQVVRVKQTMLQRLIKTVKVYVETAGAYSESKDAASMANASSLITPILRETRFPEIARLVYSKSDLTALDWQPVSPRTVWRHVRSSFLFAFLVAGGLAFVIKFWSVGVFAMIVGLAWLFGRLYYRHGRFAETDDILACKLGMLSRQMWFVPSDKVQCVAVTQSPIQRKLGLVNVSVSTAAQNMHSDSIVIEDLPDDAGYRLAESIHARSARSKDSLLDGF